MQLRPQNDPEILRGCAVAYYRYSSDKQDETSIEYQRREVLNIAARLGVTITKEYYDEEISGKYEYTEKRAQYQQLKNDILNCSPRPQYLICYKVDRIGRSQKEITNCLYDFKYKGVTLITSELDFSTESAGAFLGLLANNAEAESNKISTRTADASYEKALKGCFLGSAVPLGYKSVKVHEGNATNYRLQIDEFTAAIVKDLFESYAYTNCTIKDLCTYLNTKGIKTYRGNTWCKSSMSNLLRKPVYKGTQIYNSQKKNYSDYSYTPRIVEIPDILPRIVSNELWDLVQKKLKDNTKAPKNVKLIDTPESDIYLLTNYLHCGHCGSTMSGVSGNKKLANGSEKKYRYYVCVNQYSNKACNKCSIDKEYIEDYVYHACLNLITADNIDTTAQQILNLYNKRYSNINTHLVKQNKILQAKLNNLIDALADPQIRAIQSVKDRYIEEITALEKQIADNNVKIKNEEQTTAFIPTLNTVKQWLLDIKKSAVTCNGKQQLFRAFVKSVWLTDEYIIIYYNIGNDPDPIDLKIFKETMLENNIALPNPLTPKKRKNSVSGSNRGANLNRSRNVHLCVVKYTLCTIDIL